MITNFILLDAAPATSAAGGTGWSSMIMILLLIVIFYFFMIRPQTQKQKKVNQFRAGLKNGDKVMTAGGIYGRIREVKDTYVLVEIADGVRIRIDKGSVYETAQDVLESGKEIQK